MTLQIPYRTLFEIWVQNSRATRCDALLTHVKQSVGRWPISDDALSRTGSEVEESSQT